MYASNSIGERTMLEEINQLELERSLLNAEFDSETQKISKAKMKIALLRHKETRLSGFYEELQKEFRKKLNEAQSRISTIQEALERSPENNVQLLHEQLEIERKKFDDMEFNQMEEVIVMCDSNLDLDLIEHLFLGRF